MTAPHLRQSAKRTDYLEDARDRTQLKAFSPESVLSRFFCTFCGARFHQYDAWMRHEESYHAPAKKESVFLGDAFLKCGFCETRLSDWKSRCAHVARHFREGYDFSSWQLQRLDDTQVVEDGQSAWSSFLSEQSDQYAASILVQASRTDEGVADTESSASGIAPRRSPSASGGKRRRVEEDRAQNKRQKRSPGNTTEGESGPKFACPFYKRNPEIYARNQACLWPGFATIARLKEHLYRAHVSREERDHVCPRCRNAFEDNQRLVEHLARPDRCFVVDQPSDEEGSVVTK